MDFEKANPLIWSRNFKDKFVLSIKYLTCESIEPISSNWGPEYMAMARVIDVAEYILQRKGEMTSMKLQKLVYYSQAWHIVWSDERLFSERIEAWADGPVCPDLYQLHRGQFRLSKIEGGDPSHLSEDEKDSIDRVLSYYGDKSPQWLSDLTHMEDPWMEAREGVPDRARSQKEITLDSMGRYYSSL